jgi:hypothetical protein
MRLTPSSAERPAAAAAALSLLVAGLAATTATPATAEPPVHAARVTGVNVHRGGPDKTIGFHRAHAGEVFFDATVSAPGVSWAQRGNESAVVSAYVDGHYATDIVITARGHVTRQFALGSLRAGHHTLRLHYGDHRSPSNAGVAKLRDLAFRTVRPGSTAYAAARFAPVLYGRNVAGLGGRFQNNRTDTPLVAWHEVLPAADPTHRILEYSVVWSNEDGGTPTYALMARWGRTTDIEWIYRVEIDAHGHRVAGTGVFQSPDHGTEMFRGRYDGTHPLLQTCTSNNNVCDAKALKQQHQATDPMRFALSTREVLPSGQPREYVMDASPWTYRVMAREMVREHKVESPSDPTSLAMGDQRTYLYVAVDHDTIPPADTGGMGLIVEVRLKGDLTTYTSNHGNPFLTLNRDDPAATTVELPAGTTKADLASISVSRVPQGTDNGASLTVTDVQRAFFLGSTYLPKPSFVHWHGSITLDGASPTHEVWPTP